MKKVKINKYVWLFVLIPAAIGIFMFFVGLITQDAKTGLWVCVVYLLLSEIIMIPLSIVINALLKHGQDGKYWGAFALAAVITWVEYYVIRNLFHLASVWLMKGV